MWPYLSNNLSHKKYLRQLKKYLRFYKFDLSSEKNNLSHIYQPT